MAQKLGRVRAAQCGAHLCFPGGEGVAARGLINHVWLSKVARSEAASRTPPWYKSISRAASNSASSPF